MKVHWLKPIVLIIKIKIVNFIFKKGEIIDC